MSKKLLKGYFFVIELQKTATLIFPLLFRTSAHPSFCWTIESRVLSQKCLWFPTIYNKQRRKPVLRRSLGCSPRDARELCLFSLGTHLFGTTKRNPLLRWFDRFSTPSTSLSTICQPLLVPSSRHDWYYIRSNCQMSESRNQLSRFLLPVNMDWSCNHLPRNWTFMGLCTGIKKLDIRHKGVFQGLNPWFEISGAVVDRLRKT